MREQSAVRLHGRRRSQKGGGHPIISALGMMSSRCAPNASQLTCVPASEKRTTAAVLLSQPGCSFCARALVCAFA